MLFITIKLFTRITSHKGRVSTFFLFLVLSEEYSVTLHIPSKFLNDLRLDI